MLAGLESVGQRVEGKSSMEKGEGASHNRFA